MLNEFREFLQRGNVIDLAVAVVIGAAFNDIINSIVEDVIMPVIGIILGGLDFSSLTIQVGEAKILYGNFLQAIVYFLIISFVMFLVVRGYNQLKREQVDEPQPPPEPTQEVKLLTEIRDLLLERE
ncbi:MAG: large-conductance mechanosensitive channel protein MscL [Chloroflexota bacterium]|nr:large-conductance mechanosensitive channel protein MscL [Chloroflexota bacterium]